MKYLNIIFLLFLSNYTALTYFPDSETPSWEKKTPGEQAKPKTSSQ